MEFLRKLILTIIPLFIALTPFATVGAYLSMTERIDRSGRKKIVINALSTAFVVAMLFALVGKLIFRILGITTSDFQIAGGVILLIISILDLAGGAESERKPADATSGIVPLGVPLMVGPAVLTTIVIMLDLYGFAVVCVALVIDLLAILAFLAFAGFLQKVLGRAGLRAFSKIMRILLAAIGIMMIRKGLETYFQKL